LTGFKGCPLEIFLFFSLAAEAAREKKKGIWEHPKPRQGRTPALQNKPIWNQFKNI
jgi:hypothetical protein